MYRILIVGCGQLGSRHLQAVATLGQVSAIEIVDPDPKALTLGRERLEEVADRNPAIDYRWLPSLDRATPGGDLCILATHAEGRLQLVSQVAGALGYRSFLIEKIVAQSIGEYESLMALAAKDALSVWVHCQGRTFSVHKHFKAMFKPSEPILFSRIGGNSGLACNGIHGADLFSFYDGCDYIESTGASIDQVLHATKRGKHIYDLSGTLTGITSKGSRLTISNARDHRSPDHISIISQSYRCIVDHSTCWAWESDVATDWAWRPVPFEERPLVSDSTKALAAAILTTGRCELPMLAEGLAAHRFILAELLPHFNKLLGKESDRCPVT